ncbi:MAG: site-specific integrase [Clostridiales bacterium]|nr:site-specific integrase [Clostridiales bacterium]
MGKDLKGKELGKGITQRKDGRYYARFVDRFGNRKSLYATSVVEIRRLLKEAEKENAEKTSVKKRYLVHDWYEEWMRVYKSPNIRLNTKCHYEGIFDRHILPSLGGKYLDEVRQIHIVSIINDLNERGYGWETQNKVRLLLGDFFNVALDNDCVLKNPVKGVRLKKEKPKEERFVLCVDDQKDFFTCCGGTFYDSLYVVAVNTGLRPGEVCALEEQDIDFEKHVLHVTKTLLYQKLDGDEKKMFHMDPPKTYTSERTVPLNNAAEAALRQQIQLKNLVSRRYKKEGEFANLLFVTKLNTPICSQILCDAIKRTVDEINLQRDEIEKLPYFGAHTFRHTFATRCLEAGMDMKVLQKLLGHATLQMTVDLYAHVLDDFQNDEFGKLEAVMPVVSSPKVIPFSPGLKVV